MTKTELWVEVTHTEPYEHREVIAEFPDTQDGLRDARALADEQENGAVILCAEFEFSDSGLLEDRRKTETED